MTFRVRAAAAGLAEDKVMRLVRAARGASLVFAWVSAGDERPRHGGAARRLLGVRA